VLPADLSHGEINSELGLPSAYTERVDAFLRGIGWQL
jgi:arylformamidase